VERKVKTIRQDEPSYFAIGELVYLSCLILSFKIKEFFCIKSLQI